jgi:glycine/D-amino acid oxidase-like deaminating enzyme
MEKKVNYIIVGQGLAGTILAHTLAMKGHSIMIIDDERLSSASKVAAGLYNPVVFKRLVKSWLADDLLPCMDKFYPALEKLLGTEFYFKKQIIKPFAEEQEKVLWLKKTEEEIGKYLSKTILYDDLNGVLYNPLGASEVLHTGNLDTKVFLTASREYFRKCDSIKEEEFDYDQLKISENSVVYKSIIAEKIIFCEGHKATENPFFSWLPFKLTKGELITIKLGEGHFIPSELVINKAVFILPLGNNTYKVGATYEWADLSETITEKGKQDLIEKLEKVIKVPFEVIDHQVGIRPTVNDRRPLVGLHPQHPALGVFNGMGTKGVMLAPYFAEQFVAFLGKQSVLHPEVDIARFKHT